MKKVSVNEALLDKYTDKELVHFITTELSSLANSYKEETMASPAYVLGAKSIWLEELLSTAKALDERMNGKSAAIVV